MDEFHRIEQDVPFDDAGGIAVISWWSAKRGILKVAGMFVSDMSFSISPQVTALAVGFSAFIGIVFGIYPAWKAARKHLTDALRYSGWTQTGKTL